MRAPRSMLGPLRLPGLIRVVDRLVLRVRHRPGATAHVLIAPPGRGNIGDQALVEAFVSAVDAPVHVVVRSEADIDIPVELADRMRLVPLPALVYGTALGRARDLRTLAGVLADARSFSVIGADVMDGGYVEHASVSRSLLARRTAELGFDTRVIGFSWNSAPRPGALAALAAASRAGVALFVRDPLSAERARRDRLPVRDCADIVFTAEAVDDTAPGRWIPDLAVSDRVVLVNASGLVGADADAYTETVSLLRARGRRVVLVPHVSRAGADDVPLCRAIADGFADDPAVTLIPRLLTPSEIRGLGQRAELTVTGRMHLAVMSMMSGTPAVTVTTQGKVEGLVALFGTPQLCVEPGEGFEPRLRSAVAAVIADPGPVRAAIAESRSRVVGLAWNNVDGLKVPVGEAVR